MKRRHRMGRDTSRIPEPQGRALGMPYDWRRPTLARTKARLWNSADDRVLTPKVFGWGYDLNLRAIVKRITGR